MKLSAPVSVRLFEDHPARLERVCAETNRRNPRAPTLTVADLCRTLVERGLQAEERGCDRFGDPVVDDNPQR